LNLFRVLSFQDGAEPGEPGSALYVPGSTGRRIDNAGEYKVLYVSREPEGAIAQTYGRFPIWKPAMFASATGTPRSLVSYSLPDDVPIFSLDNTAALAVLGVPNPSQIIARNRRIGRH
jgi:hypothetical protein